jgi:hypothetical protein
MWNNKLKRSVVIIAVAAVVIVFFESSTWSTEKTTASLLGEGVVTKQGKKYPHPHALHLAAMSERTADFSVNEITDWRGFLQALKQKLNIVPFSPEGMLMISNFKSSTLNSDEKAAIINEINRLLQDEKLFFQVKDMVALSSETKRLESDYGKTKSKNDLKWLNRSIITDIFPQIPRIGKVKGLKKMTCATCHEAYAPKEGLEVIVDERTVMECFSKAVAGEKDMKECIEKVKIFRESQIKSYGPLKLFIQRSDTEGEIPFFVAVHPENPYTFKPILKRLVCLECHSRERRVDKVKGLDGKIKEIPIFYGVGSEKRHEH